MKLLPSLLLNVVVVALGLFVYDQLRGDPQLPDRSGPAAPVAAAGSDPEEAQTSSRGAIDPDEWEPTAAEVRRFGRYMDRVQQIQREDRMTDQLRRRLSRQEVALDPDVEQRVLVLAGALREKLRSAWREMPRGNDAGTREAQRKTLDSLRAEFEGAVKEIVPEADVEKVVSALTQGAGFPRRER